MTKDYEQRLIKLAKEIDEMAPFCLYTDNAALSKFKYLIGYIEALEEKVEP